MRRALPLAIAFGAHLAALGVLHAVRPPVRSAPVEPQLVEIDLAAPAEETTPTPMGQPPPGTAGSPGARAGAAVAAAAVASPPLVAVRATAAATALAAGETRPEPQLEPTPPTHANDGWSFSPTGSLAIDPRAALAPVARGGPSPETTTSAGRSTGGVAEALARHDMEVGIGRGGAVLAAAEAVARSSDAPLDGDATFDVVLRADGTVDVQVASASSEGWSRLAAQIARSIDTRRIRMPGNGHGWHVVVRVEAKVLLADGRDPKKLHGPRVALTPSALQDQLDGKPGSRGSSTGPGGPDHVGGGPSEPPPQGGALGTRQAPNAGAAVMQGTLMRIVPTPTITVEGKVCSAALTVTPLGVGFGGGCSLENIGTGTSRHVSGRIVSEAPM